MGRTGYSGVDEPVPTSPQFTAYDVELERDRLRWEQQKYEKYEICKLMLPSVKTILAETALQYNRQLAKPLENRLKRNTTC